MQSQSLAHDIVSCRSLHRLATYADHLYRAAEDRFSSQEWRTGQEVIKQKQAEVWRLQIPTDLNAAQKGIQVSCQLLAESAQPGLK